VTQELQEEGVEKFNKPYDRLMQTLATKRSQKSKKQPQNKKAARGS